MRNLVIGLLILGLSSQVFAQTNCDDKKIELENVTIFSS